MNKRLVDRITKFCLMACILVGVCLLQAPAGAAKYSSIVVDGASGAVLGGHNMYAKRYPASLTKSMTLYLVFEQLRAGKLSLSSKIRISKRAARRPPSKLELKAGSTISVKNAIMALVTKSANDVATAVAEHIGKTESQFAVLMTRKARQLGMYATQFKNASGLPNSGQITTAHDMAILGVRIYKDFPQYYKYFSSKSFTYRGKTYSNHNRLLRDYSGTDGIKTGYIRSSGYNLLASATRNNRRLVAVVFGGSSGAKRNNLVKKWLNHGFVKLSQLNTKPRRYISAAPTRQVTSQLADLHRRPITTQDRLIARTNASSSTIIANNQGTTVYQDPLLRNKPHQIAQVAVTITDPLLVRALQAGKQDLPFVTKTAKVVSHNPNIDLNGIKPISAPKTPKTVALADDGRANWKVQVGAYKYQKQALRALNTALKTLGWQYKGRLAKQRR
ncbi:MAG: D-alanyl-D-alanine carboxypeptidase family protein, partial [Pseudomonadota bacterium]